MPEIARCPERCTQLRYVPGKCEIHELRWQRIYVTEGDISYLRRLLEDRDPVSGRRFDRNQTVEHKELFSSELARLHRNSPTG
jgi:hypothetical protein